MRLSKFLQLKGSAGAHEVTVGGPFATSNGTCTLSLPCTLTLAGVALGAGGAIAIAPECGQPAGCSLCRVRNASQ